jgi:hypothetical protein
MRAHHFTQHLDIDAIKLPYFGMGTMLRVIVEANLVASR